MTRKRRIPQFYAVWTGSDTLEHDLLVCVYDDARRAAYCAVLMGATARPVSAGELRDYLAWRATLAEVDCDPDPLVSLYLRDDAPFLHLSALVTYLENHA